MFESAVVVAAFLFAIEVGRRAFDPAVRGSRHVSVLIVDL